MTTFANRAMGATKGAPWPRGRGGPWPATWAFPKLPFSPPRLFQALLPVAGLLAQGCSTVPSLDPHLEPFVSIPARQALAEHVTSPSDTLWDVARRFDPSLTSRADLAARVAEIKALNGLRSDIVPPGARLRVPTTLDLPSVDRILESEAVQRRLAELQPVPPPSIEWSAYGKTVVVRKPITLRNRSLNGRLPNGTLTRYVAHPSLGDGSQREGQKPLFVLIGNARLENVIIDHPAADGVHVHTKRGDLALIRGVEFRDVGEDAISLLSGPESSRIQIARCKFRKAEDKVIQVNRPVEVRVEQCDFLDFKRAVRGCGDCGDVPYRITVVDCRALNGHTVLKLSNPRARGTVLRCQTWNVDNLALQSGDARIRVEESQTH